MLIVATLNFTKIYSKKQSECIRIINITELKEIRGSNAYDHVQELLNLGLISRKKDKNGRSYNLKTTPKFTEYFKIKGNSEILSKMSTDRLTELLELNK